MAPPSALHSPRSRPLLTERTTTPAYGGPRGWGAGPAGAVRAPMCQERGPGPSAPSSPSPPRPPRSSPALSRILAVHVLGLPGSCLPGAVSPGQPSPVWIRPAYLSTSASSEPRDPGGVRALEQAGVPASQPEGVRLASRARNGSAQPTAVPAAPRAEREPRSLCARCG